MVVSIYNGMEKVEVLSVRKYKAGYIVQTKKVIRVKNEPAVTLKVAYSPQGDYIGNSRDAYFLCKKRGIKPEFADPENSVCSIGFCEKDAKWYGWSHRAICGFGIGDIVKEGDCTNESGWTDEYLEKHPEENKRLPVGFKAETLEDAKKMAIAFAESVS